MTGLGKGARTEVLGTGLLLYVDGVGRETIRRMLETKVYSLLQQHETRYRMIREGAISVRNGDSPILMTEIAPSL